jgi:dienelactone hydrolase
MIRLAAAIAMLAAITGSVTAQVARVEIHPVSSITLRDGDFLAGRKEGQPVTLAGELRIPKPGNDRLPAIVLLHGSGGIGGIGSSIDEWSRELNQLGIATFTLDSFAGRGLVSTVANQTLLGRLNMVADAYRALEILAKHPRIDPRRIAVMGFSRGGQSALYSAMKRLYVTLGPAEDLQFAAHIALYPDCMTTYRADTEVSAKPIRILHGAADDYNPVAPCRGYVERLTKLQVDIKLIEYPSAHHVFDAPALRTAVTLNAATTTRSCQLVEADDGQVLNHETQQPFTFSDACVEKGPTVAFNEAANAQARAFVRGFLTEVFKLQ